MVRSLVDKKELLICLDELFELTPGTLKGEELLVDLEAWDSLTVIGLIALVDEKLQKVLSPNTLIEAKTINDILGLVV